MMQVKTIVFATMLILAVGGAAEADNKDEARTAFDQGKDLFDAEKYAQAAEAFRLANKLNPSWKILYNVGQCEAAAKRYGLALEAFERYLAKGGDDVPGDRREEVLAEVEQLRKMVGSLDIRAPRGCVVMVDDVNRGRAPLVGPLMVAAGVEHWVKVKRVDVTILDRIVRVSGGQTMVMEAKLPTETAEVAPRKEAPKENKGSALKTWGWVAIGMGGAMLAGGAVTGGVALSQGNELEDDCTDNNCPPNKHGDVDRMNHLGAASTTLLITGAAAAATGAVLLILDARGNEDTSLAISPAGVIFSRSF